MCELSSKTKMDVAHKRVTVVNNGGRRCQSEEDVAKAHNCRRSEGGCCQSAKLCKVVENDGGSCQMCNCGRKRRWPKLPRCVAVVKNQGKVSVSTTVIENEKGCCQVCNSAVENQGGSCQGVLLSSKTKVEVAKVSVVENGNCSRNGNFVAHT